MKFNFKCVYKKRLKLIHYYSFKNCHKIEIAQYKTNIVALVSLLPLHGSWTLSILSPFQFHIKGGNLYIFSCFSGNHGKQATPATFLTPRKNSRVACFPCRIRVTNSIEFT